MNFDEVVGCTDNTACNYDFSATDSDLFEYLLTKVLIIMMQMVMV